MVHTLENYREDAVFCIKAYNRIQENPEALKELYEETEADGFYKGIITPENLYYCKEGCACEVERCVHEASFLKRTEEVCEFIEEFTEIYKQMFKGICEGIKIEGY